MGTQRVKLYEEKPKEEAKKEFKQAEATTPPKRVIKKKEPKKRGKKWQVSSDLVTKNKNYPLSEAIELVKKTSYSSFDGSIEAHVRLEPRKNQTIFGTITLPYGSGKEKKTEYKADSANIVHQGMGKVSWEAAKVEGNLKTLLSELNRYKITSATISATMGPGIKVKI